MASRWYLRPSASSEADTVLPYHPSAPVAWQQAFPAGTSLPPAPPHVLQSIAARNDNTVRALQQEVSRELEGDGELMRRIRARQKAWSNYDAAEGGVSSTEDGYQKLMNMDRTLPMAFQFHQDSASMHRLWSEAHPSTESAIARPVPCHLLQTPRPVYPNPASTTFETTAPRPAVTQNANGPLILTVSVYSRHVLRSTRQSRARAAAEKRYDEFQQEKRTRSDDRQPEADPSDHQAEVDGRHETMEKNLFLPKFGSFRDETQDDPRPSQRLEIYSNQTLLDLCEGIICRMDDLPERDVDEERLIAQHIGDMGKARGSMDPKDRTRYTGKKRAAEKVMLLETCLAGQAGGPLSEHVHQQLRSRSDADEQYERADLASVKISDLIGKLCLHKPYWYCHQGICEHFFTIDELRLPDPKSDPPPPSAARDQGILSRGALEQVYRHPLTTYLMAAQLSRPTATLARLRGTQETYSLGYCTICDKLTAKFAVIGGERVGSGGADEKKKRRRGRRGKRDHDQDQEDGLDDDAEGQEEHLPTLPALRSEVELLCPACLAALTGHVLPLPQPKGKGKEQATAPSEADEPVPAAPPAKRKYTRRAKDVATNQESAAQDKGERRSAPEQTASQTQTTPNEREDHRGLPSAITAENLRRNAQVVSDDFNVGWHEAARRLRSGAKGWTIVPLLD